VKFGCELTDRQKEEKSKAWKSHSLLQALSVFFQSGYQLADPGVGPGAIPAVPKHSSSL